MLLLNSFANYPYIVNLKCAAYGTLEESTIRTRREDYGKTVASTFKDVNVERVDEVKVYLKLCPIVCCWNISYYGFSDNLFTCLYIVTVQTYELSVRIMITVEYGIDSSLVNLSFDNGLVFVLEFLSRFVFVIS